ncbi:MAG: DNA mismatch repair protein [Chitinophagaceae bacterium]|nr:DNA mismatch repair protein [Chitinophagaceae bacterium]
MSFITDKQTIDDLNIFGKRGHQSVYEIFNRAATRGGAELLENMFRLPLAEADQIRKRSGIIRFFQQQGKTFPLKSNLFDTTEHYLSNTDERSRLTHDEHKLGRMFRNAIGSDTEYQLINKGVLAIWEILNRMNVFLKEISDIALQSPYVEEWKSLASVIEIKDWAEVIAKPAPSRIGFDETAALDRLFRYHYHDELKKLLFGIYSLDVYMAVAGVAEERKFIFPEILEKETDTISFVNVYHPHVKNAKPNSLHIAPDSNIVFLTGANMAGKSTLMKSLAISLYLAHMGFPVAAQEMKFSVRDGVLTSINLPDNLSMGYSHFYAEVLRVKKMAEQVGANKRLFFIVDELFKGTNVKDAYEATVAITAAFAERPNCMFIVSTHIMEAGDTLRNLRNNINFVYLPTLMESGEPVYTYRLEKGITADRHGMVIITNEGILDILKNGKKE